jgi:sugar lactone lactonase YvrE
MSRRLLISTAVALALGLALGASTASAVIQRSLVASFGPDGSANEKFFRDAAKLAIHQATDRIYVMPMFPGGGPGETEAVGLYGYDITPPHNYTPRGGLFPITPIPGAAYVGGFTVDNTNTATAGRLYQPAGGFGSPGQLSAWEADGTSLGLPWPIKPAPGSPAERFCEGAVHPSGDIFVSDINHNEVHRWSSLGVPKEDVDTSQFQLSAPCAMAFDSQANLYVTSQNNGIYRYSAASNYTEAEPWIQGGQYLGQITIDKSTDHLYIGQGNVVEEYDENGNFLLEFGDTYGAPRPNFLGVAVDEDTHEVYAADEVGRKVRVYGPPKNLPSVTTDRPTDVSTTSANVYGSFTLDGGPAATDCFFQYGASQSYEIGTVPCEPEASPGSPLEDDSEVKAQLTGLTEGVRYYYRLVVTTSEGTNIGNEQTLIAVDPSFVKGQRVLEVTADHALLDAEINPKGVKSDWYIEYGPADCAISECEQTEAQPMVVCGLFSCPPNPTNFTKVQYEIIGLNPGQLYHFRFVSANDQNGIGYGPDRTFRTFPLDPAGADPCPNAKERQLSGATKLSHCRGYELVSAADAGGYDVASNIVEGETPLDAYPEADDEFLYTTSVGKLPGIDGFPVNLGTDPYVATRGDEGWTTKYVGLAATLPSDNPFASTVSGADAQLGLYAFGEPDRCSPCFGDGTTGIPLRLPDGSLIQGMHGSEGVADPQPAGNVAEPVSANGEHFVFSSVQKFEPEGNAGSLTIYDRNLATDETQVASTMPDGSTMTGDVEQLDISGDGSRILIGKPVGTDAMGNSYHDLYMHIGDDADSVLVVDTPGGVLYNGMSDDGTKVYFTTTESLDDDADASADIFRADVGTSSATVTRVSTGAGGTGQSDECEPPDTWNSPEGVADCSALAFAGGAGVASGDGTLYFLSPEQLDGEGNGLKQQPNLYVARPGQAPEFIALVDDSHVKPPPSPPKRPLLEKSWGGAHTQPESIAVDEANDAVYVLERSPHRVSRYTLDGGQLAFTEGAGAGTNKIGGLANGGNYENAVAADSAEGSMFQGSWYTPTNSGTVGVFNFNGKEIGSISGFGYACGVAVDQATGDLYIGDWSWPGIRKFHPISNAEPVSNANYEETSIQTAGINPCQVAAGGGNAYASQWNTGPVRRYPMSSFSAANPSLPGTQVSSHARMIYVDASNGQLYVGKGKEIHVYEPDEEEEIPVASVGVGTLTNSSRSVAVNGTNHHVYANHGTGNQNQVGNEIAWFGYEEIPFLEIDHPAVLHAKQQAAVHHSDDFQTTPDGDNGVFATKIQNTAQPTDLNFHVFRYNEPKDKLDCVSCTPTSAITTGDSFLAPHGTNVDDGGRVYFTSPEQLTLRDTNRRTDAYEWEEVQTEGGAEGVLNLISTGTGVINAALASVSADGKNAFFFTRESIIPQDDNGPAMKVYTAREGGGYSYLPEEVRCAAADECRGPGTKVAPPPAIGTYKGTGGNLEPRKRRCRKGFVWKRRGSGNRGRCVKRNKAKRKAAKRRKASQGKRRSGRRG